MKIIFIILTVIHALIHVMGFLKAFHLAEINELSSYISKPKGIIWLVAALLLGAAAFLLALSNDYWWLPALSGVIISQVLIFIYWNDACFGTILNVIVCIASIISAAQWNFNRNTAVEVKEIFSHSIYSNNIINEKSLASLPAPVKKWLKNSRILGKKEISRVYIKQYALMKLKPDDEQWKESHAEQYFSVNPPAFLWRVSLKMMPLISVTGRDIFYKGQGSMIIKILSLFNVVNEKGYKIDTGTMQRFLGEIVWFPSAALSPYIQWKQVDNTTAEATMKYKDIKVKGTFYFNDNGEFIKYKARRYMGNEKKSIQRDWIIEVMKHDVVNGIKVPVEMTATWKLDSGNWNWLKLKITDIKYNEF